MKRLAVLISGSGSNLQTMIDACATGLLEAQISVVVSNRKAAYGLERAKQAKIPSLYFPLKPYTDAGKPRETYDLDLAHALLPYAPDLIVLAGFMHIFSPVFLEQFPHTINLHPALPGTFPGAHGIQDAFDAFVRGDITQSGCMVHVVTPELDAGPVIATAIVPFKTGDTLDTFRERMQAAEHQLLVQAITTYLQTMTQTL
jgi:formyltetrahydrofolate-dependent phosphoribosylglycinamide formyltransferase